MSVNKVILLGYVSNFQEVQIRTANNGKKIATFTLVTSENWKDKSGEKKIKYENHHIVVYNESLATIIEKYVEKGSKLYIEGVLQTSKYTDNNGVEKYTTQIILQGFNSRIEIVGGKSNQSENAEPQITSEPNGIEDDIPFF